MAMGRIELLGEPGRFVASATALRLLDAKKATLTEDNKLRLRAGAYAELELERERTRWSSYSKTTVANRTGNTFLRGYLMNGAAINRSEPCA